MSYFEELTNAKNFVVIITYQRKYSFHYMDKRSILEFQEYAHVLIEAPKTDYCKRPSILGWKFFDLEAWKRYPNINNLWASFTIKNQCCLALLHITLNKVVVFILWDIGSNFIVEIPFWYKRFDMQ